MQYVQKAVIFLDSINNQRNTLYKINYLDEYITLADTAQMNIKKRKRNALLFCFFLPLYHLSTYKERNSYTKSSGRNKKQQPYPRILLKKGKAHIFGHSKAAKTKQQRNLSHG